MTIEVTFNDYRTDFFWPKQRADEFLEVQVLQNCPTLFTASGITLTYFHNTYILWQERIIPSQVKKPF